MSQASSSRTGRFAIYLYTKLKRLRLILQSFKLHGATIDVFHTGEIFSTILLILHRLLEIERSR